MKASALFRRTVFEPAPGAELHFCHELLRLHANRDLFREVCGANNLIGIRLPHPFPPKALPAQVQQDCRLLHQKLSPLLVTQAPKVYPLQRSESLSQQIRLRFGANSGGVHYGDWSCLQGLSDWLQPNEEIYIRDSYLLVLNGPKYNSWKNAFIDTLRELIRKGHGQNITFLQNQVQTGPHSICELKDLRGQWDQFIKQIGASSNNSPRFCYYNRTGSLHTRKGFGHARWLVTPRMALWVDVGFFQNHQQTLISLPVPSHIRAGMYDYAQQAVKNGEFL